ncbi:beta-glucuronidase, partial [bacterium]|nr:beta-glucuronidase [bacterium]
PSIITWTPLNETILSWPSDHENPDTYRPHHYRLHVDAYDLTRTLDPTRLVNETSGYVHVKTDLYTIHEYAQDPEKLKELLTPDPEKGVYIRFPKVEVSYTGQPYLVDEFGGIKWIPTEEQVYAESSWGYGDAPKTLTELYDRLQGQVDAILSLPHICGYCYTQLTDVEQEQNGLYNYDRTEKFDMRRLAAIFGRNPK